jgi:hypothetical protein
MQLSLLGVCDGVHNLVAEPLMGAFLNMRKGSVQQFQVIVPEAYPYPAGMASCLTNFNDHQLYLEHAGRFFEVDSGADVAHAKFFSVVLQPGRKAHKMVVASGGVGMPATTLPAMACSPTGQIYVFGGLVPHIDNESDDAKFPSITWAATKQLYVIHMGGNSSAPELSKPKRLASSDAGMALPGPRSGHCMVYLPPSMQPKLNTPEGALLLFGGSNVNASDVLEVLRAASRAELNVSQWVTSTWLYDIAADN